MVQGADTSQTLIHMLGQGPQLPAGSVSISINPPSAGDDGSDDDSEPEVSDGGEQIGFVGSDRILALLSLSFSLGYLIQHCLIPSLERF